VIDGFPGNAITAVPGCEQESPVQWPRDAQGATQPAVLRVSSASQRA
jgi:hypothetical protein